MVSEKSGLLPAESEYAGENGGVSGNERNLSINQQEAGVTGKYNINCELFIHLGGKLVQLL